MRPEKVADFFSYARERHNIYLKRKRGEPAPWTDDPVLRDNRFCNVFRELDRTTEWFRTYMREPLRDKPWEVLLATVVFRWFNRIETGQVLLDTAIGLKAGRFNSEQARARLRHTIPDGPYVTGAYIIKTPDGMNKLDGVLWCIDQFLAGKAKRKQFDDMEALARLMRDENEEGNSRLESAWEWLRQFPFLGDFMAYEVVTDLRHTCLLDNARDICLWANPGPGAARGLDRLLGWEPGTLNRSSPKDRLLMDEKMGVLLGLANMNTEEHWPKSTAGEWEMREVEHTLCEFDKFERAHQGGKMKQRFKPR
jgi:hypothetical protein